MKQSMALPFTVAFILCVATVSTAAESPLKEVPPPAGHSLGSVTGGDFSKAKFVIQKKCTSCHGEKVIKDAIAAGKNMKQIQARMEQKGVALSADDRQVLGVFYQQSPLKKK